MVHITIVEKYFKLLQNKGPEDILNEYKEFYLRKSLSLFDYKDLQRGILNSKTLDNIHQTIIYYFDKYFKKYLVSLTNIDKFYLQNILLENFSNFFIGVSDNGTLTGFPITKEYLPVLIKTIREKISIYYQDIIGLHYEKGVKEIQVGSETFYDFEKLLNSLKKHTKINVHILEKNDTTNEDYVKLNDTIMSIFEEEKLYQIEKQAYQAKKLQKKKYNEIYSTSFHKLIRSKKVMNEFKQYLTKFNFPFDEFLDILKSHIQKPNEVEKYLSNGSYIKGTLFEINSEKDNYWGEKMSEFLYHYKDFKFMMLKKNITIEPFSNKSPKLKLNSYLKNISCFSKQLFENDDVYFICIQIEVPFIKDKKAYLGLKENSTIRIIGRTYESTFNTPCTQTN